MDQELKRKWVEALRSGEYQQGNGKLCDNGRYCCLGVLYDIVVGDWRVLEDGLKATQRGDPNYVYDYVGTLGLSAEAMPVLANMNDGYGDFERRYTFSEIADYIEANL